jgi:hypothetical protein
MEKTTTVSHLCTCLWLQLPDRALGWEISKAKLDKVCAGLAHRICARETELRFPGGREGDQAAKEPTRAKASVFDSINLSEQSVGGNVCFLPFVPSPVVLY